MPITSEKSGLLPADLCNIKSKYTVKNLAANAKWLVPALISVGMWWQWFAIIVMRGSVLCSWPHTGHSWGPWNRSNCGLKRVVSQLVKAYSSQQLSLSFLTSPEENQKIQGWRQIPQPEGISEDFPSSRIWKDTGATNPAVIIP